MTRDEEAAYLTAAQWTAWLEDNHGAARGIWLALPTKGTPADTVGRGEALDIALCFGWIDGQADSATMPEGWWALRHSPRRPRSSWSKINCLKAERLIAAGRMRPPGLAQIQLAKADGRWAAAYDPPSRAQVPADLRAALAACPPAFETFEKVDARNRYLVLRDVEEAKRPDTRARRIAVYVARLAAGAAPRAR